MVIWCDLMGDCKHLLSPIWENSWRWTMAISGTDDWMYLPFVMPISKGAYVRGYPQNMALYHIQRMYIYIQCMYIYIQIIYIYILMTIYIFPPDPSVPLRFNCHRWLDVCPNLGLLGSISGLVLGPSNLLWAMLCSCICKITTVFISVQTVFQPYGICRTVANLISDHDCTLYCSYVYNVGFYLWMCLFI
jgi:hypothetical protein